jgi:DNA-binding transcriptional LysR family regulator
MLSIEGAAMSSMRQLRTFLAAARHGSFAAAGKAVGLTAAAVGQQMHALEEDLGMPLFDRSGRSVVLNPSGRALVPTCEELLARYAQLGSAHPGGELAGTVVMGALVSALMGAFADALWALKQASPQLEVRLFAGLSADFAVRVERGELDAAVVTQSPRRLPASLLWTALVQRADGDDRADALAPPDARRAAGDVAHAAPSSASTARPGPVTSSRRRCARRACRSSRAWS